MGDSFLELQEEYKRCWQKFVKGEEMISLPNPLILESWSRCREYKVDPYQKTVQEILDENALNILRRENAFFRETSLPMLENIYEYFKGSGFTVVLSEANGYLIEVFGDAKVCDLAQQGKWVAGARWNEKSGGTNVIGMSIVTDKPISLTGYECYCHYSHKWSGAGAPIHDSEGRIVGAIGLAGLITNYNPHTLGMVIAAAKAIEIQLAMKQAWDTCAVSEQHKSIIIDSIYEGILVTDPKGEIILTNRRAQKILRASPNELTGARIDALFSEHLLSRLEKNRGPLVDIQDEITFNNNKVNCFITCQHIIVNGRQTGLIFILNEVERTKNLVDKMLNKTANNTFADIIGSDPRFRETVELARTVAPLKTNVLLLGDSGTGKEIFAQAIHNASAYRLGPFVAVNCGAMPKDLIGSEIFGYADGAFTGASKGGKAGKFELADGGTLFLDEVGEMPMEQQKVFLRIIEEKKITRLGGQKPTPVDVRIIAATNKNLEYEVLMGNFRQDLYYRLNSFTIRMLPLKEHKDDIKPLAIAFLDRMCREMGMSPLEIKNDAWDLLYDYDWPGNIRELQHTLERALVLSKNQPLTRRQFDFLENPKCDIVKESNNIIKDEINQYEAELLRNLLKRYSWNITRASLELGVSRTTLYRKIRLYEIDIPIGSRN